jgi:hypothetical protein
MRTTIKDMMVKEALNFVVEEILLTCKARSLTVWLRLGLSDMIIKFKELLTFVYLAVVILLPVFRRFSMLSGCLNFLGGFSTFLLLNFKIAKYKLRTNNLLRQLSRLNNDLSCIK